MIFNEINNIHILGKKEKDSNSAYRDLRWLSSPSSGPSTPSNQRPFRSLQAELFETLKYNKISIYLMSKKKEFSWWLNSGQNFHNATSLFSKNNIKLKKKIVWNIWDNLVTSNKLRKRKFRLTAFALYHPHNELPTTYMGWYH